MKWTLYSDGASRGNPGEAAAGVMLVNELGKEVPVYAYLGKKTNNQAEYEALILGLNKLMEMGGREVEILADSELMIRQILGQYKVKNEGIIPLHARVKELLKQFKVIGIRHIPRAENKKADALANLALDER